MNHLVAQEISNQMPFEFRGLFPFKSKYQKILRNEDDQNSTAHLHYVDEGPKDASETIVLSHGNPTWSFFFRSIIMAFSPHCRVIALDHLGCGLSDRTEKSDYTLKNRIFHLEQLVSDLKLKKITLVLHDWGGAIGMGLATKHPELIEKLIILNTAAFEMKEIPWRISILKNPMGKFLINKFNLFSRAATEMAVTTKLSGPIKACYTTPYKHPSWCLSTSEFVEDIPMNPRHKSFSTLKEIEHKLKLIQVPTLIVWGMQDFCFTEDFLLRWVEFYPHAKVVKLENAGHYLLEDAPEKVVAAIQGFLS